MKIISRDSFQLTPRTEQLEGAALQSVKQIIQQVREQGDQALFELTERFDGVRLEQLQVSNAHFEEAVQRVSTAFLEALREAMRNIQSFHAAQKRSSYLMPHGTSSWLGQLIRPLNRVGVYVPGGTAAYPSSVLMGVIPAQVAGVKEIVLVSPPGKDGRVAAGVLAAARELGIDEVYPIGGAQAIAALAYGTESVRRVDKIVGPGNLYVALAKQQVFGQVGIDSIAGPSDILVIADDSADPEFAAADLLSQAEHGELSQAILLTTSSRLAEQTAQAVEEQVSRLPRGEIARQSIANRGAIVVCETLEQAVQLANEIAPEHLELLVSDPDSVLDQIETAGAVFVGPYSSEPVGDYFCGTNHILPTEGTARFSSALGVDDFIRKTSLIRYSRHDLVQNGPKIIELAETEGLQAHAEAIRIRMKKEGISNVAATSSSGHFPRNN